jgi:hypothetical protein
MGTPNSAKNTGVNLLTAPMKSRLNSIISNIANILTNSTFLEGRKMKRFLQLRKLTHKKDLLPILPFLKGLGLL